MQNFMCRSWPFVVKSFGVAILNGEASVQYATGSVGEYLVRFFGCAPSGGKPCLPSPILEWLGTGKTAGRLGTANATPKPYCLFHSPLRLVIRATWDGNGSTVLLFSEQSCILCPDELGKLGLTQRESEVLRWMAEGKGYDVIGTILNLSRRTVENYARSIFTKFNVSTRNEAVLYALDALGEIDFAVTMAAPLPGNGEQADDRMKSSAPGPTH